MAPGNRSVAQLQQGKQAVDAALRLEGHASERERGYIHAVAKLYDDVEHKDQRTRVVAYADAMNDLAIRQPADTEAKIFYAISLTASASPTDKTYVNQLKAGGILEPLWAKQPNHPGLAHYIIHTYAAVERNGRRILGGAGGDPGYRRARLVGSSRPSRD